MKSINLEKGQYQFLTRIKENPGINQKKLSSLLLVDKTTTAKAVNKLVAKGYINKKTNISGSITCREAFKDIILDIIISRIAILVFLPSLPPDTTYIKR